MTDTLTAPPSMLSYDAAKVLARSPDVAVRREMAGRTDLPPEILYYLAEDSDEEVRRLVAANPATPAKAAQLLATDKGEGVRVSLATKLAALYPGLPPKEATRAQLIAYDALEALARDEVVHVRQVLADALKSVAEASPVIINRLARDVEIIVAGPVLQHSPVLSSADLVSIICSSPIEDVLTAIARRTLLDESVTDALIGTNNTEAITHLLRNDRAQIREATLDQLIDRAASVSQWHEPLVYRPGLTSKLTVKLAQVVAGHLLQKLLDREDLDIATAEKVAAIVHERLTDDRPQRPTKVDISDLLAAPADIEMAEMLNRVQILHDGGGLDEAEVRAALIAEDLRFVVAALSVLAGIPVSAVLAIAASHSGKAVSALAWKAGLTPAASIELQIRLGHVDPQKTLKPTVGGEWPLTEESMDWQIELFSDSEKP